MESNTELVERIAVLETEWSYAKQELTEVKSKLDELIQLKAKGMGAIGLASLVIGSGVLGLILTIFSMFKSNHL